MISLIVMKRLSILILGLAVFLIPQLMINTAVDTAVDSALHSLGRQLSPCIHATAPADNCTFDLHATAIADPVTNGLRGITLAATIAASVLIAVLQLASVSDLSQAFAQPPPKDVLSRSRRFRF